MTTQSTSDWEKEFDKEYDVKDIQIWSCGIIAETLNHARTKKIGTDASYLSKKLQSLIKLQLAKQREEIIKIIDKGIEERRNVKWVLSEINKIK